MSYIFILLLLQLVWVNAVPGFQQKIEDCKNQTKATEDEQFNVISHKIPVTKNEQCMLACLMKKNGQLTSDNKINIEKLTQQLQNMKKITPLKYNNTIKIIENCKASEKFEKDECVAAKNYAECVYPKERLVRLGIRMKTFVNDCANETKASEIEVDNVLTHVIPKQKNEKCMFSCIQKKMGNMKDDNTIDVERMKRRLTHIKKRNSELYEKLSQLLDDCKAKEKKENDACEAGGKFAECIFAKENELRKAYAMNKRH